jgi:hypothetical protein
MATEGRSDRIDRTDPVAPTVARQPADVFDEFERLDSVRRSDRIAEQSPEQTDVGAHGVIGVLGRHGEI